MSSIEQADSDSFSEKAIWWATASNQPSGLWSLDYPLAVELAKQLDPPLHWLIPVFDALNRRPPLAPRASPQYSDAVSHVLKDFFTLSTTLVGASSLHKSPYASPAAQPALASDARPDAASSSQIFTFSQFNDDEEPDDLGFPKGWDDALELDSLDLAPFSDFSDRPPLLVRGTGAEFKSISNRNNLAFSSCYNSKDSLSSPFHPDNANKAHVALLWPPPAPWLAAADGSQLGTPRAGAFIFTPVFVFEVRSYSFIILFFQF
jgi:hypothetical protein